MPRAHRLQVAGGVFHITSRGNRQQPVFVDDRDRLRFLEFLAAVCALFGWKCHAYCLMGNHYHLLIETPEENLSAGMQRLNSLYAQWFNRRYGYTGHLFQGRFHSGLVETHWHLLELARYIVLNPVRAGLCARAEDWRWSSFLATTGRTRCPRWLHVTWLMSVFAHDQKRAREVFASFVADACARTRPP